jgi:type I restriction enzyme M protein
MSINATVKAIQDIMRKDAGVDGDAQRIGQLGWMLFLKIFDDQEQELELTNNYSSPMPNHLRWRDWAADPEGITGDTLLEFINNDLFPTLKQLSTTKGGQTPRGLVVQGVFEDAFNYMKNGTLVRQVVNKLNEIDFNRSQDRHLFNDIYEKILKDLQSAGNAGEFYTPRAVTQFMVDMIDPKLDEQVLDPACGTGGFLTCAIEHKRNKYVKRVEDREVLQTSFHGIEKKQLPHLLCITNMLLHGIEVPVRIRHDNGLARPLKDYGPQDRVDVIITNPPFGGMEEDGIEQNFPSSFRTRETADLFLVLLMRLLKERGRAAIVLPDGFLFGEGIKTRIKEKLLGECNLHTIVRLPNSVFAPYTGIKTNLLFFEKGEPTKDIWYFEHKLPEGQKAYNKTKPIRIEEFDVEKQWWGGKGRKGREETEQAWRVDIRDAIANNYNLDIKNPHVGEQASHDPGELLRRYQQQQTTIASLRNQLKGILQQALNRGGE